MIARNVRLFSATLAGVAVLLAGALLAHADGYGFSPPGGWRPQRPPSGYAGLWVNPAGREAVNLATTSASSLNSLVNRQVQKSRALYPSMHVYSNVPYHVCGRHDARYLIWTATSHGASWIHEQVMADWQDNGFVASYVRPASYPPNRAARAALVSVCGVAGGSLSNPSAPQAAPAPQQGQPETSNTAAPVVPATPTPYAYPSLVPRYAPVIPN